MRNVSIQELEEHTAELVAEAEAGSRFTLIRGGRAVAELVPASVNSGQQWATEDERVQAIDQLMETMRRGYDLGGFKITDRDALYDRD